jgi:hypothetical protein
VSVPESADGVNTFTGFTVSQSSFTPDSSVLFGDYINIAASNKKVYPVWMRMESTKLSVWTALIRDTTTLDVEDEKTLPRAFSLSQNCPDPFNPTTKIQFRIPRAGFAVLKVHDVLGREIATLVNEMKLAGVYSATWDAGGAASGEYLFRLQVGSFVETKRMVPLR